MFRIANLRDMQSIYVPGRKPVLEMLESGHRNIDMVFIKKPVPRALDRIIDQCRTLNVRFKLVPGPELDRLSHAHQGVVARLRLHEFSDLDQLVRVTKATHFPVILVLDQVQDPGNLGTLARTIAALGAGGLIVPRDRSAPLGPGAMKASAGALIRTRIAREVNLARTLDRLHQEGMNIYGATMDQGESFLDICYEFPAVLVLGGEEKGIRPNVLKRCTHKIHIPMPGGLDSMNVAQAGAIIFGRMLSDLRTKGRKKEEKNTGRKD